jgi:hypothetical protein
MYWISIGVVFILGGCNFFGVEIVGTMATAILAFVILPFGVMVAATWSYIGREYPLHHGNTSTYNHTHTHVGW